MRKVWQQHTTPREQRRTTPPEGAASEHACMHRREAAKSAPHQPSEGSDGGSGDHAVALR